MVSWSIFALGRDKYFKHGLGYLEVSNIKSGWSFSSNSLCIHEQNLI